MQEAKIVLHRHIPTMQAVAAHYLEKLPSHKKNICFWQIMSPQRMNQIWDALLQSTSVTEATKREIMQVRENT